MPAGSSPKRERQYEHIKESYEERGVNEDEAEERAARTVNKQRREHGETEGSSKSSSRSTSKSSSRSTSR
jgi:plasmid stabilization system protein ParE